MFSVVTYIEQSSNEKQVDKIEVRPEQTKHLSNAAVSPHTCIMKNEFSFGTDTHLKHVAI